MRRHVLASFCRAAVHRVFFPSFSSFFLCAGCSRTAARVVANRTVNIDLNGIQRHLSDATAPRITLYAFLRARCSLRRTAPPAARISALVWRLRAHIGRRRLVSSVEPQWRAGRWTGSRGTQRKWRMKSALRLACHCDNRQYRRADIAAHPLCFHAALRMNERGGVDGSGVTCAGRAAPRAMVNDDIDRREPVINGSLRANSWFIDVSKSVARRESAVNGTDHVLGGIRIFRFVASRSLNVLRWHLFGATRGCDQTARAIRQRTWPARITPLLPLLHCCRIAPAAQHICARCSSRLAW